MDLRDALKLVAVAASAFPGMQQKDLRATAELWAELLGDLDYRLAEAALARVLLTAKYFPTIAEIREAAMEIKQPEGGLPSPESAWEEVLQQVRKVGWIGEPKWSHPAVGRAALALHGSWQQLCASLTEDSLAADRAHFMRIYASLTQRERDAATLPPALREAVAAISDGLRMDKSARKPALPGDDQ